mmetsp:Transcript_2914/g.7652  ORF Transcript_2914/g.7652 Transcript_2914/m.7652 type:complete len:230 (+) Transcript_2914:131-820(+)
MSCSLEFWVELLPGLDPSDHGLGQLEKVGVQLSELLAHLARQLQVAVTHSLALLRELDRLEEWDDFLLPEDSLVLLLQVGEGVAGLAVPDIGEAGLDSEREVVANNLGAPARPHVVVPSEGLPVAHQTKVHGWSDDLAVEGEVHAAHWEQGALGHRHHGVHVSLVPLRRLHQLRRRVVVGNVEPQAVRDDGLHALPQAEGVPADEVAAGGEGVVQRVEEEGRRRRRHVL